MPQISHKGRQMPESPIRKLVPYAETAKQKGIRIYHLNIGQPDIHTPEQALQAVTNHRLQVVEYSHSGGNESYRKKLAAYYQRHGLPIEYTDLLITTGGSEALQMGMMTCLNPGDEIIIPEPFYANYLGFATAAGCKVVPVTSAIENGFALPPISAFEEKISERTKAIVLSNPGNPTGYLYSRKELEQVRDLVVKNDLYLFSDEVYREFCYDGRSFYSALSLEGLDAHVIMVDSVSKRYSMCGARIGALVSKNKEVIKTALKFAQARLSPPTFGQIAAEAALETPQKYFDDVVREYAKRRDVLVDGLNRIPGVYCPNPGGAFYAMAQLPISDSDHFCQWLLESFHLDGETIMLAPATGFYATKGLGKNEVRIGYVLNTDALRKSCQILEAALAAYPHKIAVKDKISSIITS